jgi:hypothetical protein
MSSSDIFVIKQTKCTRGAYARSTPLLRSLIAPAIQRKKSSVGPGGFSSALITGTGAAFAAVGVDADHAAEGAALGTTDETLATRAGRAAAGTVDVAAVVAKPDTFPFDPIVDHTPPVAAEDAKTGVACKDTYN